MKKLFLLLLAVASTASGTTFTVTNTNDSGAGSLRQAVIDANAAFTLDDVQFALGSGTHTITLTSGEIDIDSTLDIIADPSQTIIIDGNNASRIFDIDLGTSETVALEGCTCGTVRPSEVAHSGSSARQTARG